MSFCFATRPTGGSRPQRACGVGRDSVVDQCWVVGACSGGTSSPSTSSVSVPADVVALKLRNRVEFVVLLFACWRLGATVTPVNPSLTEAEVVAAARGLRRAAAGGRGRCERSERRCDAGGREPLREGAGLGWATAGGSVDAGTADLHQRHHRGAQGSDARSRQPRCHGRDGTPSAGHRAGGPVSADPAAVSRQRHRGQRADAAARGCQRGHRRAV